MTTKQIQKSTQNTKQYTNITDAVVDYAYNMKDNFHTNIIIKTNKEEIIDYSKELQQLFLDMLKKNFNILAKKYLTIIMILFMSPTEILKKVLPKL